MTDYTRAAGLTIDWETADKITISTLKDMIDTLHKDNIRINHLLAQAPGKHLDSDLAYNHELIKSIKVVLSYFGEVQDA